MLVDALPLGTFHSTCVRILRKWHAELGFRQSFVIYDDADQLSLIKDCLKALSVSERVMNPRGVAARISRAKNEMLTPGEYAGMAADFTEERTAKITVSTRNASRPATRWTSTIS